MLFNILIDNNYYSEAARQLNMTQPPLTAQINILEKEIGVQLFIRTPRGVRLTEVGNYLFKKVAYLVRTTEIIS